MKIKEIVVFLLCIPTASQATITAGQCKPSDDGPPHVELGCGSADHSPLPTGLLAVTAVASCHPRDLVRHHELETGPGGGPKEDMVRPLAPVSSASDLVVIAMPFSSLQLSPSLVEYLGLIPNQITAIQNLMDQERPTEEPLMHALETTSSELGSAIQQRRNNHSDQAIQRLSAVQTKLLEQLMTCNSRLRQHINGILSLRQRKRLDTFIRTTDVTVGEGN